MSVSFKTICIKCLKFSLYLFDPSDYGIYLKFVLEVPFYVNCSYLKSLEVKQCKVTERG